MPARSLSVSVVALLALVFAACGGGADRTDPQALLEQTFSGEKTIDSGRLRLDLSADIKGSGQLQGPVSLKVEGPFAQADGEHLAEFDFDATVSGAGMTYEVGAAATGDKGFVRFQGSDYVLADAVFRQFTKGFEEAQRDSARKDKPAQLANLGIDPRRWLTNARNEGEADVGDDATIKITGDVNVPRLVADLSKAAESGRKGLGERGAQAKRPGLTTTQQREIAQSVKAMRVEVYTGKDDKLLRRLHFDGDVVAPAGAKDFDSANVKFDYSVVEVNEDQKITAPATPRPFDELARQLGGLGGSGAARGADAAGKRDQRELKAYTRCLERAGDDDAAVKDCASRL